MMDRHVWTCFSCLFLLMAVCNCNSQDNSQVCREQIFYSSSLAIGTSNSAIKKTDKETGMIELLNQSGDKEFIKSFRQEFGLDSFTYNGFSGVYPKTADFKTIYLAYRCADFKGDLDKNSLMTILLRAYSGLSTVPDSVPCLRSLLEIENSYLSAYLSHFENHQKIDRFHSVFKKFSDSKRAQYLWARLNYDFGSRDSAIILVKQLLAEKYYEKPVLKLLTRYYDHTTDSLIKYSNIFSALFPAECNLAAILLNADSLGNPGGAINIGNCNNFISQKDSMTFKVFLGKYYLDHRNFSAVQKLFDEFRDRNTVNIDDFKIWEKGEYYDLILQSFFLQKKYKDIYFFVIKDLGYNGKIVVENGMIFTIFCTDIIGGM
jgi:hypothetical protein